MQPIDRKPSTAGTASLDASQQTNRFQFFWMEKHSINFAASIRFAVAMASLAFPSYALKPKRRENRIQKL